MKKRLGPQILSATFLSLLIFFGISFVADAQISNSTYSLESSVVSSGGGTLSDSTYSLDAVVGESFVGRLTNGAYDLFVGFLTPTTACSDGLDNDGDGLIDMNDNGCSSPDDTNEFLVSGGGGGGGGGNGDDGGEVSAPECTVTATPSSVLTGESITVSWSGVRLQSYGHQLLPFGVVSSSGSRIVEITEDTTFDGTFFGISGASVNCSATVTVVDPSAGEIIFEPQTYEVSESDGTVALVLQRQGGTSGPVSARVAVQGETLAQAGADYVSFPETTVSWADGESGAKTINVTLIDDAFAESVEFVEFEIVSVFGALTGVPTTAMLQINDDDAEELEDPTLTIIVGVENRGLGMLRPGDVTVAVNGAPLRTGQSITLPARSNFVLSGVVPVDYRLDSITGSTLCPTGFGRNVTIPESANLTCRINYVYTGEVPEEPEDPEVPEDPEEPEEPDDPEDPEEPEDPADEDPDEGTNPDDGDIGTGGARSEITLQSARRLVEESDGSVTLYLERRGPITEPVTASLALVSGTAQPAIDYGSLSSTTVSYAANEGGVRFVEVPIITDELPEDDETFQLVITNVTSGSIGNATTEITIRDRVACTDASCLVPEVSRPALSGLTSAFSQPAILGQIENAVDSEAGTRTIVATAIASLSAGAAAGMVFVAANPGALADLATLPVRLWSLFLSLLGLKRRGQPWGVVYDSLTKQPLDPAYVALKNHQTGEEVTTSITDIDGRYGFLAEAGTYVMSAGKTNYTFPSQQLAGKTKDELYDRLYFGDPFTVSQSGEVIAFNIPMDPVGKDWNQQAKTKMRVTRFYNKHSVAIAVLTDIIFYAGIALTALGVLFAPERYNIILLSLYGVIMVLRIIGLNTRKYGRLIIGKTGDPVPNAMLRFVSSKTGVQVAKRLTDGMGRYYALLSKGTYDVVIEVPDGEGGYTTVGKYPEVKTKQGIIRKFFKL